MCVCCVSFNTVARSRRRHHQSQLPTEHHQHQLPADYHQPQLPADHHQPQLPANQETGPGVLAELKERETVLISDRKVYIFHQDQ